MFELTVESSFSGAHQLLKSNTPCENLHGHNWRVQVAVRSEQQDAQVGWVMDFKVIKTALSEEMKKYDHKFLNDVLGVSPTAENIAKAIYQGLQQKIAEVYRVSVWETETCCVSYFE